MAGGIRFELLGTARVLRDGVPAPGLGKKALALLAFLATPAGKRHNREQLATLLWGGRFEEQARQSLRQTLTSVRKPLGEVVLSDEGGVGLDIDQIASDSAEFEAQAARRDAESLSRACDLYAGDFVASLGNLTPEFDDWAGLERTRLRNIYLDALETLARLELDAGRAEQGLAAAQRLLSQDPANEAGCRAAMTALARLGRRSAALRQFEASKAALARTLGAAPAQETLDLLKQIQQMPAGEAVDLAGETAPGPGAPTAGRRKRVLNLALAAAGVAVLAGAGFAAWRWFGAGEASAPSACAAAIGLPNPAPPVIVVLPMQVIGGDRAAVDFAIATNARILDMLGDTPALVVMQAPRGRDFAGAAPREIAAQLGATHLLEAEAHVEPGRLQVSLRLIEGASGTVLRSHARDYDFAPAMRRRAQDAVVIAAAETVQVQLTEGEQALNYFSHPTSSMEVFEHLTRAARHLNEMSRSHTARARQEYAAAHALDPSDPRATSGLGWTYMIDALFGWSSDLSADLSRARELALQSIASDPNGDFFYPHSLLALVALMEGDHNTALARAEEAARIGGASADSAAVLALVLTYTGEPARAADTARAAMRLRPLTYPPWYEWILGRAARLNGETGLALSCMPRGRVRDAGVLMPMVERAIAVADAGDLSRARREMQAVSGKFDGGVDAESYCAHPPYADAALTARCIADLRRLER